MNIKVKESQLMGNPKVHIALKAELRRVGIDVKKITKELVNEMSKPNL